MGKGARRKHKRRKLRGRRGRWKDAFIKAESIYTMKIWERTGRECGGKIMQVVLSELYGKFTARQWRRTERKL